ncbi:MAG: imidazolonepropionase [Armatimonadota bacterium]|nr:imidazolonepropionase [Armatimonadota bacterium]MDR7427307.1 imidazolonepropionase [Armatimonadota bacterium]MDR7469929.1 imidazolonepropionase [Armatimonadota bacterium]MDR7474614.1 imidazolonepropionase [Armatimonadota bacterium]MDR7539857.1 imidazolonepropionase [Armatimonadota bacterium]
MAADLLIVHAGELLTLAAGHPAEGPRRGSALGRLGLIRDGALAVADGLIVQVGTTDEVRDAVPKAAQVVDAAGRVVLPGFVDAHTHLLFGGWRAEEFELRLGGATYQEIAARGGGILHTVAQTRGMTEEALVDVGMARLSRMLAHGTTTVEAKSGYGLSTESELTLLRALHRIGALHHVDVVPTFLGAHAVPPEFSGDADGYVRLVIDEMLPAVAEEDLAEFCDVFCERGAFTVEQSRAVLEAGVEYGLAPKIHADELSNSGGARLAAQVGAVSADHLEHAAEEGLRAMAAAGVIAVVLPGTAFFLGLPAPPVRRMVDLDVAVALGTDFNPGSSPTYSMQMATALGVLRLGLGPAEAVAAATINAAHAIGVAEEVGSLEPGKVADVVILDATDYRALAMQFGVNLVDEVYKRGRLVYSSRAGFLQS